MAVETKPISPAEHLERRIRANRFEAERWRSKHGDPTEAIGELLRNHFSYDAFMTTYEEYRRYPHSFMFDDIEDADGSDVDEDGDARESR